MPVLKTRIHELRKERKMQQSDLAELVGVRRETIGNLENGNTIPRSSWQWISPRCLASQWNTFFSLRKERSKLSWGLMLPLTYNPSANPSGLTKNKIKRIINIKETTGCGKPVLLKDLYSERNRLY